ncbi:MAG: PAS domain-containing protein [Oscillochloris sp.]|nr:PAS domain-containing protein [Oscillochloris sp.]
MFSPPLLASDDHPDIGLVFVDRELYVQHVNAVLAELGDPHYGVVPGGALADVLPWWAPTFVPMVRRVLDTEAPVLNVPIPPIAMPEGQAQRFWSASFYPAHTRSGYLAGVDIVIGPENPSLSMATSLPWPAIARILDIMPVGLVLFNSGDLQVRWANTTCQTFLEAPAPQGMLVGCHLEDCIPQADASEIVTIFRQVASTGQPYTKLEYRHEGVSGSVTFWRWSLLPVTWHDSTLNLLLVTTEITESVQLRYNAEAFAAILSQERTQLAAILEHLPVALVIVEAPSGRIIQQNAEAKRLLHHVLLPTDDANGCAQYAVTHLDGRSYTPDEFVLTRALRGEVVQAERQYYRRSDGTLIQLEVSAAPVRDAEGRVVLGIGTFQDHSARRQTRPQLQPQAYLLEQAYEPMLAWELPGPIIAWNRGAEELYGFTHAEAIGQVSHDLLRTIHPTEVPTFEAALLEAGQWQGDLQHMTRDGRTLVIESRMTVVAGVDGRPCVLEVNRDITERRRDEERLRYAQEVTASFVAAQTLAEVGRVIVDELVHALGATIVGLRLIDAGKLILKDLTRSNAVSADTIQRYAFIPLAAHHPAAEVARTGVARFHRDVADIVQNYPHLAEAARAVPAQANAHLPLKRGAEVFGVLSLHFASYHSWDAGERAFVLALANRAAVAYERARLFEAEREARKRSERLLAVTTRLATALTPNDVVRAVLEEGLPALGSTTGTVMQLDGDMLVLMGTVGYPQEQSQRWQRMPLTAPTPLAEAVRTRANVWLETTADFAERYGRLPDPSILPLFQAGIALPLIVGEQILGAFGLSYAQPETFDLDRRRFAETLAGLCAQALERSRFYEAAQRARATAEAAVQLRDQFLSIASHELRTPLTVVVAHAQAFQRRAAREHTLHERDERSLQQILIHADRLNRMITMMLDVSRIDQGRLNLERAPLDLTALVGKTIARTQGIAPRHQIVVGSNTLPCWVVGDTLRLEQVLDNLLGNAIKYSPSGGIVTVDLTVDDCLVHVAVQDQGIGIPTADLPYIFDRFSRASNVSADTITGVGIGLFVLREIITLHGGTVTVASEEGVGSTFTISLSTVATP